MGPIKAIGSAIGGIFSTPKMPKLEKPQAVVSPHLADPEATAIAARKKLQSRALRGREGTIYGGSYSGTNLGGTA